MKKLIELRLEVLTGIFMDIAQVFFASLFVGPMLDRESSWVLVVSGFILSILFWFMSLIKIKKYVIIK
ncbi:MAG: hypothetical protein EXS50_01040 [Candidatus Taylorbacteria bacterium]|nr:hypothetical protein [Candidatus Taylorbacteria bacterium]